jgi:hypothetical protein
MCRRNLLKVAHWWLVYVWRASAHIVASHPSILIYPFVMTLPASALDVGSERLCATKLSLNPESPRHRGPLQYIAWWDGLAGYWESRKWRTGWWGFLFAHHQPWPSWTSIGEVIRIGLLLLAKKVWNSLLLSCEHEHVVMCLCPILVQLVFPRFRPVNPTLITPGSLYLNWTHPYRWGRSIYTSAKPTTCIIIFKNPDWLNSF